MLMQRDATVCICHAKTRDLAQFTILADILVVAAGRPNLIVPQMVKTGAVVIDVGINRLPERQDRRRRRFRGRVAKSLVHHAGSRRRRADDRDHAARQHHHGGAANVGRPGRRRGGRLACNRQRAIHGYVAINVIRSLTAMTLGNQPLPSGPVLAAASASAVPRARTSDRVRVGTSTKGGRSQPCAP